MENIDPDPQPIILDEHDSAAVAALLIRTVRIDEEQKRDKALIEEATARLAASALARGKTINAFTVFGFDTGKGFWDRVREALGSEVYLRSLAIGRGQEVPKLLEKMGSSGTEKQEEVKDVREPSAHPTAPRIKEAILEYMRSVGEDGANVRDVRNHLASAYNLEVHEKTPGMTLYRLLKEGLVRREKRVWYAREPAVEKEIEASSNGSEDASETAHTAQ